MKRAIQLILKYLARKILAKHNPYIVGITGSVGKTSAKEAVYAVLKNRMRTRRSLRNYNNEIGLPLTIIGADSPGKNIVGWLSVFLDGLRTFWGREYPEALVLEMGVDRPGDMDYLLSIAGCRIGMVTMIGSVHAEYFGSRKEIAKEKGKLVESIGNDGWAILNADNEDTVKMADKCRSKVLTFGFSPKADIRADGLRLLFRGFKGLNFKIGYRGSFAPVMLENSLGINSVYSALAAASVGVASGMNLLEISQALREYKTPKGRMSLLAGIKGTYIIDDTYNAEPSSVAAALDALESIPAEHGGEKYAILGDMLELGRYSESEHMKIGAKAARSKIDKLILVGERSRDIGRGAEAAGMEKDRIFHFSGSEEAGVFAQDRIKKGDIILVKGSQGTRMEKTVREIMAEPLRAGELLVRQGDDWLKK